MYMSLQNETEQHVKEALGQDDNDWQLKNTCPACMYKLKDETQLIFDYFRASPFSKSLSQVAERDFEQMGLRVRELLRKYVHREVSRVVGGEWTHIWWRVGSVRWAASALLWATGSGWGR